MPTDLTAAAKRWTANAYPREPIVRLQREIDAAALADAMAAELDDTPLAAELLDQILGPRALDSGVWVRDDWVVTLRDGTADLWNRDRYDRYRCRTLGQLRTAMRQAGVQPTNTEAT